MSPRRTIAVVTGTRAEFGLLEPVLRAIQSHRSLRLRTIVAGAHLTQGTWRDVAAAGFAIDAKAPMQRAGEVGRSADVAALARGVASIGKALDRLRPDVVIVLGDRIEAFAAASAAAVGGFMLAHIHGGDRAEGVADEAMRHAISKLAHLHFAATAMSRDRLVRMGERADRVFNVGSPAIDAMGETEPLSDVALEGLGLEALRPYVVVMQHPVGARDAQEKTWLLQTLAGVDAAKLQRVVMAPNADPGSHGIWAGMKKARVEPVRHLPRGLFLGLLARAAALVGNSSAGLIEAAAVRPGGLPVVNIGPRQGGRERPRNVIDCAYGEATVAKALRRALARGRHPIRGFSHPYGDGRTGPRIAALLATIDLAKVSLGKQNSY
ncbi:MAG: UDP-N-acetylglucosamine 2-epimerase [Planctomycetota bacterium]|nr:UDP-N-acetylglucosamine 2-epimerase [Planctomycetota bacterium]